MSLDNKSGNRDFKSGEYSATLLLQQILRYGVMGSTTQTISEVVVLLVILLDNEKFCVLLELVREMTNPGGLFPLSFMVL